MVKLLKPVAPFPWAIVKPPALAVSGETVEREKDTLRRSRASSVGFTFPAGSLTDASKRSSKAVDWVGNSLLRKLYVPLITYSEFPVTANDWVSLLESVYAGSGGLRDGPKPPP